MKIRELTINDYPSIVEIHNSLKIIWPTWSTDPGSWLEADRNRDPKCKFQRWVAMEDDKVVGAASFANHLDDYHPQKFYINIEVLETYRNRGIGTALFNQLMLGLEPNDPRILRTDILENQIQSFPFVQHRGFREVWRETPVHLEVDGFDYSSYSDLEPTLTATGIKIKTLQELACDPDRDRKVYHLYIQLEKDVPSEYAEFTPSAYEDWLKWCLNDPTTNPEAFFIAVQGDQYIALHELGADSSGQALLGGLLGTLPDFRNKRIGLVLMLRAISFARQNNLPVFRTCTAKINFQMQSLFDKLGFTHDPEWLQCQNDL